MRTRHVVACAAVIVVVLALATGFSEASCMGSYHACLKESQEYLNSCVNGNFWYDVACGLAKTAWNLSSRLDVARCSGIGR